MTTPSLSSRATIIRSSMIAAVIAFGMTLGTVFSLHALGLVGIAGEQGDKIANAILTGMDVATALAIFGGPVAIGGWVLFLLKNAIRKGSKSAIVY